jgi:hypothetical protein
MFYALCHAVDSFLGRDKNAPKKSPAGMACRCFAARLCRPPRFGRYAPSSLRPAQPRKTNSHRIYRTDVALTRSFAVDAIQNVTIQASAAVDVSDAEMDSHFRSAYGIFAGTPVATAVLIFSAERARWVEKERWHPDQQGEMLPDGRYRLSVPYADERELIMDIQRHGSQVLVAEPESLRQKLANEAGKVLAMYADEVILPVD